MVSYESLKEMTDKVGGTGPFVGNNEEGEHVIVTKSINDEYFKVETLQKNNWCRINIYHKDGTTEETYQRNSVVKSEQEHTPVY